MRFLELKVPPVAVALVIGLLSWTLSGIGPALPFPDSVRLAISLILIGAGLAIAGAGVVEFRRAQTTVNPHRPKHTSTLVTTGIYRRTRNPMYLGLLLLLSAWAFYLGAWLGFAPLALFVLYMDRFQIEPEEHALSVTFGDAFSAYRSRVRRWL